MNARIEMTQMAADHLDIFGADRFVRTYTGPDQIVDIEYREHMTTQEVVMFLGSIALFIAGLLAFGVLGTLIGMGMTAVLYGLLTKIRG